jgi:hypothetical protein
MINIPPLYCECVFWAFLTYSVKFFTSEAVGLYVTASWSQKATKILKEKKKKKQFKLWNDLWSFPQSKTKKEYSHNSLNNTVLKLTSTPLKLCCWLLRLRQRWVGYWLGCSRRPRKRQDDRLLENHSFAYSQSSRRYGSTYDTQSTRMRRHGHYPNQPSYGFL